MRGYAAQPRGRGGEAAETAVADLVIARIVRRGVVTGADLRAAGVTRDEIRERVRRKRLIPVHRGVYFVGHPAPARFALEFAALKAAGDGAVLSHRTAAVLWRLLPPQVDPTIHVSRAGKRAPRRGLKLHEVELRPDEQCTVHGDLQITTVARTLLDNADHPQLEQMVADAIRRRLTTRAELEQLVERHRGARHIAALRKVLDAGPLWAASELERRFMNLLRRAELPLPESNVVMGRTIPDLVWRAQRVLVELDSRGFHGDWIAQRADRGKDRRRTLQGWTCLRYTPEDVRDHPFVVVGEIAAALAIA